MTMTLPRPVATPLGQRQQPSPFAETGLTTEELFARFKPTFSQRVLLRRALRGA